MNIWSYTILTLSLLLQFFLPGIILLSFLKIKLKLLDLSILSLGLGIAITTTISFWFRLIGINSITFILPVIYILILILQYKKIFKMVSFRRPNILSSTALFCVIFIGVICQASTVFNNGNIFHNRDLYLKDIGDSMWNFSLVRELIKSIPPIHPGFSPEKVTNYHYFTHLFIAEIGRLAQAPLDILFFNFFSVFTSAFFGLSSFILGRKMTKSNFLGLVFVIFSYFIGSFSYLLPFWLGKNFSWNESSFWVSQPISMIFNPSLSISFSLFALDLFCLYKILLEKERNFFWPCVLLSGTLISFKVYAGIIILFSIGILAFFYLFRKDLFLLKLFIASVVLSFMVFLPSVGGSASGFLVYAPFWFLHTMVENPDRLNIPIWALKEQTYWAQHSYFALLRLRMAELFLFITGNLGTRVLGLLVIPLFIIKKIKMNALYFLLLIAFSIGIIIPLFFIQKGSVGNTIQFFYYSLVIGNIFLIIFLDYLNKTFPRILFPLTLIIIILGLPTSLQFLKGTFIRDYIIIPKEEVEALSFVKGNTPDQSIILLPITSENNFSMYVSAFSYRNTYLSHKLMVENTLKDYQGRENNINKFFLESSKEARQKFQKNFISQNKTNLLYLKRNQWPLATNILIPIKLIFANSQVRIFLFN